MNPKSVQQLRVAIWGGTGATGSELLGQCLDEPRIGEIRVFTRRPLASDYPRVAQVLVDDFLDLSALSHALRGIDAAFWCLGVSQSAVPQEQRYREITRDYAIAGARALKRESPNAVFHFLSGMGADLSGRSRMMWARIKGEAEVDLTALDLHRLVVWRPAYIHAVAGRERPSLGDRLAVVLSPIFRLIPNLANSTVDIAHAMLHETFADGGNATHGSKDINELARKYRDS